MTENVENLESTTFFGKRFTRKQITKIQETVSTFPSLTLRELSHTICEHFEWITPKGTYKVQFCLSVLDELENEGLVVLPKKRAKKKSTQKKINWTDKTTQQEIIHCSIEELMPLKLELVIEKQDITEWNEFVDRYHYLGYKRPIGCYIKYFITSKDGKKLGCLLFSYATWSLPCRDKWVGWKTKERKKNLELVINNNRFLIFPWVEVKNLASKALSIISGQISDDWENIHGYRPLLLETFVDPEKYKGTCYKASNWQYIGKSAGNKSEKNRTSQKDYYVYPLSKDFRSYLMGKKKLQKTSPSLINPKFQKTENIKSDDPFIKLWQKVIALVYSVSKEYDQKWQKRKRVLDTMLIILFVFRLIFSKNKQGYQTTITELWNQCKILKVPLPQSKPVAASAFCSARKKLDENIFRVINTKLIEKYEDLDNNHNWKNLRVFAVDGTKINLPKQMCKFGYTTPSNNAYYPQGLVSCLYQLKSKIPYDFDLVSHQNERAMALSHLEILNENDVVVYDRGYFSYSMLYHHTNKNINSVFRIKSKTFKEINEFMASNGSDKIVKIIPSVRHQKDILLRYPEIEKIVPLKIRLINYTFANTKYTLGTTLLDNNIYKTEEFPQLYHSRWGVEELYKISKVIFDIEDFHGQTERGVKQELFAHFVLITLNRFFANKSEGDLNNSLLENNNLDTKQWKINFKNCLFTISRNLEGLFIKQADLVKNTINSIIDSINSIRQKERLNRKYKRVSFKPRKNWVPTKSKSIAKVVPV